MALMGLGHINLRAIFTPFTKSPVVSPVVDVLASKNMNEKDRRRLPKKDWPEAGVLEKRVDGLVEKECSEERVGLNLDERA